MVQMKFSAHVISDCIKLAIRTIIMGWGQKTLFSDTLISKLYAATMGAWRFHGTPLGRRKVFKRETLVLLSFVTRLSKQ